MKVLGGLAASCMLLVSGVALAVVTGSKHDFTDGTGSFDNTGNDQVCKVCHAPHNNLNAAGTVLWNHNADAGAFTMYTSPSFNDGAAATLGGASKLCLSCHDGATAIDSFLGGPTTNSLAATGVYNMGKDLSNDHPISFAYDAAGEDLKATTELVTLGDASEGTIAAKLLVGGNVECSSCHDPHNKKNGTNAKLVLVNNVGSGLCKSCHTK